MAKVIVVFDQDDGNVEVLPLGPGGFVCLVEKPLKLLTKSENHEERTITLVLKHDPVPASPEGAEFLNGGHSE